MPDAFLVLELCDIMQYGILYTGLLNFSHMDHRVFLELCIINNAAINSSLYNLTYQSFKKCIAYGAGSVYTYYVFWKGSRNSHISYHMGENYFSLNFHSLTANCIRGLLTFVGYLLFYFYVSVYPELLHIFVEFFTFL